MTVAAAPDLPLVDARADALSIEGDVDTWRSLGLDVADDGTIALIGTSIRIVEAPSGAANSSATERPGDRTGIVSWSLSGRDVQASATIDVDGLVTEIGAPAPPVYAEHALGASGLDHVVVMTADLERTSAAIAETTGCELKRIREVGTMRQGFHRIGRGGLIVELVERPDLPGGPASFWGLVLIVEDIDAACALIGDDRISAPKDAVQPGRRIATVRADVSLGLPVALMTH